MLKGKRVLIVIGDCPELPEVAVPLKYFRERGATVKIAGQNWIRQWRTPSLDIAIGQYIACDVATTADLTVSEVKADDFDLVVFPGGAWSPDSLRVDPDVQRIIREFYWKGKLVASICHGPWVFINASVDAPEGQKNFPLSGMNVTGVTNIRLDLKNAGGIVHTDQPVVVDNNVITSRDPNDLGPFCETLGKMLVQ